MALGGMVKKSHWTHWVFLAAVAAGLIYAGPTIVSTVKGWFGSNT